MPLTQADMETRASELRKSLSVDDLGSIDPFKISITGVKVITLAQVENLPKSVSAYLYKDGSKQWSAMTVPLEGDRERWVILLNDSHDVRRQKVSLLEEIWHILEGHELTSIVKIGDLYGRSFASDEEHDAYYLACATLVPLEGLKKLITERRTAEQIATHYGVSRGLVEYRIKRLGLWAQFSGKEIRLVQQSE